MFQREEIRQSEQDPMSLKELIVCSLIGSVVVDAAIQAFSLIDKHMLNESISANVAAVVVGAIGFGSGVYEQTRLGREEN